MKTNNETIDLPLLITKATTSPLMELDWMQRLEIHLETNHSETQLHNIKMNDIGNTTLQLKNEFKDLFYNNKDINDLSVKSNIKEGAQVIQQKENTTNTKTLTRTSCE